MAVVEYNLVDLKTVPLTNVELFKLSEEKRKQREEEKKRKEKSLASTRRFQRGSAVMLTTDVVIGVLALGNFPRTIEGSPAAFIGAGFIWASMYILWNFFPPMFTWPYNKIKERKAHGKVVQLNSQINRLEQHRRKLLGQNSII